MKKSIGIAFLALAGLAFAQQQSRPVSQYMRNMGLLYLEEVDTLPLNCGDSTICEDRSRWESTMDGIQDKMEITLSEGKRPAGDTPYRDLLLKVRYARYMYTLAFSNKDANKTAWMNAEVECEARAHTIALDGEYHDEDADCDDAIEGVAHPEIAEKKRVAATVKACKAGLLGKTYCDDYMTKHPQPSEVPANH